MKKRIFPRSVIFIFFQSLLMGSLLVPVPAMVQGEPRYGGILKIAERSGPSRTIGVPWEGRSADSLAMKPAIESLLYVNNRGELFPCLATEWKVAPDRSSITFALRKGVKFHDGSDFNSRAVLWNLRSRKERNINNTGMWESIEALDDYTIRINLSEYDNTFLYQFTGTGGAIISKESFDKKGLDWVMWNPLGTGPFKFTGFKRDKITKFVKNENYWKEGRPYLDGMELHYIKDSRIQLNAMKSHGIDVLGVDFGDTLADLRNRGFKIESGLQGVVLLIPDSNDPDSPFADQRVREALSYAIDRDAIVRENGFGFIKPAYQCVNDGSIGWVPELGRRYYDPQKAMTLLSEAGYPNGFETKIIPMMFGTDKDIWISVKNYLERVGIRADIEYVPYYKYTEYRFDGWHNGLLAQPFGVYPNPNQTLKFYLSEGESKVQFPVLKRSEGFKALREESLATIFPDQEKIREVIKQIHNEAMVIPVYETGRAYVMGRNVHDTGHMRWGMWTDWRPDNAWLSR